MGIHKKYKTDAHRRKKNREYWERKRIQASGRNRADVKEDEDGCLVARCIAIDEFSLERCVNWCEPGYIVCPRHNLGGGRMKDDMLPQLSGRYSGALVGSDGVGDLYEKFRNSEGLVDLRDELALQKALLSKKLQELVDADPKSLCSNSEVIDHTIDGIRKTTDAITKMQTKMTVMVHITHVQGMMDGVVGILREELGEEPERLKRIAEKLESLQLPATGRITKEEVRNTFEQSNTERLPYEKQGGGMYKKDRQAGEGVYGRNPSIETLEKQDKYISRLAENVLRRENGVKKPVPKKPVKPVKEN